MTYEGGINQMWLFYEYDECSLINFVSSKKLFVK